MGIAPRKHVEYRLVGTRGELGERGTRTRECEEVIGIPVIHGNHCDNLLGEHIKGIAGDVKLLDQPGSHSFNHHGRLD